MSLDPRLVAIQGIGFSAIEVAVQGLIAQIKKRQDDTDQGMAGRNKPAAPPARNYYVDRLNAEFERQSRITDDDTLATEFIMTLVQSEILNG